MPYTDFHYTPTGTGVISGNEVLEQTEDAINDLGGQISGDVQTAIDTANNALNTANTASADAQNAVNTANTAYTAATNAQNTANAAQNTASNALTAAQNAQNDVNALGNRVTTAENNITQNTTDISGLTTRMGTAEGNITTLQNDVVTAQGTATSAQNTATMARQQAYVLRYSSTAITDNSTIAYSTLDNTDNIKVSDKIIDTDGKIFSIASVDTTNQTVTVGSALIDLALDSNVVHTNEINSSGIGIIESVKEVGGANFNTLTTQGLYGLNASGSTNNPEASPCVVQVIRRQNSVIQIASVSSSAYKSRYIRYCADITAQSPVWQSWIKFATDDNVMHLSGDETVAGIKTFSDDTYIKSLNFTNEVPSPSSSSSSIMPIIATITYGDSSPSVQARLNLRVTADGIKSLYPHENNAYSLGLTSRSFSDFYTYHGYFRGSQQGDEYSPNARTNLTLLSNRDTLDESGILFDTYRQNTAQGTGIHVLGISIKENSVRYEGCRFGWYWDNSLNGYYLDFKPTTQGTYQAVKHNLGTSTDKWDTINGINPGVLSFPDLDNGVDISGYISVNGGNVQSTYTPPVNGWISIALSSTGVAHGLQIIQGNFGSSGHQITDIDGNIKCLASMPVKANVAVTINSALNDTVVWAYFYPCQGNI